MIFECCVVLVFKFGWVFYFMIIRLKLRGVRGYGKLEKIRYVFGVRSKDFEVIFFVSC